MATHPFAGFNPKPSHWGYNWMTEMAKPSVPEPVKPREAPVQTPNNCQSTSPEPQMMADQYANMPAALLNTLKREKKPFTYTPGGVNLSEVLNARLQKRNERKKKYSQEKMATAEDELPKFDPPRQVIVMPTYNTPLDMYSMENALEALEVQAGLVANDKSLTAAARSATLPRNHTFRFDDKDMDPGQKVTQSKAFRVLQIITDTEEDHPIAKHEQIRDEMRFSGLRDSKNIPSKFFHTLQKITGTEEEEEEEEEQQPKQMQQAGPTRSASFKNPTPAARPPFMPQQNLPQFTNGNRVAPQPTQQPQFNNNPALKRPAAFLPIKTTPGAGFRPVQPPFLSNGPLRRVGNPSAGTDF